MIPHPHPPVHPAEVWHGDYTNMPPLYVVMAVSNPIRFNSRYQLALEAFDRVEKNSGAILIRVEAQFNQRPFVLTDPNNPNHVQVRIYDEIWQKENLLNLGAARVGEVYPNWDKIAWVDADVGFVHPHWALETVQQLQHFKVVQMFTWAQELDPNYDPLPHSKHRGFVYGWLLDPSQRPIAGPQGTGQKKGVPYPYGYPYGGAKGEGGSLYHPGYAWAMRRLTWDGLGGLIDYAIMGQADYHMAQCLVHNYEGALYPKINPSYKERIFAWQARCDAIVNGNIGYVEGTVVHYWHGKKADRRYWDRNKVLTENDYNPNTDIMYDHRGVLKLSGNKRDLRDGLRGYFRERDEDSNDVPGRRIS